MSLTLVLVDDPKLESIYGLNLKVYTGTEVIFKKNMSEVVKLLEVLPGIDLIILHMNYCNEADLDKLEQITQQKKMQYLKKLALGSEQLPENFHDIIANETDIARLVKRTAFLLGVTAKDMSQEITSELYAVPTGHFYHLKSTNIDVYQRKFSQDSEEVHFEKCLSAHQEVPENFALNFQKQAVHQLFVLAKDRLKFTNYFSDQMVNSLLEEDDPDNILRMVDSSMQVIRSAVSENLDISEEVIKLADKSIQQVVKGVKGGGKLKDFLKRLLANTQSKAFQHAQLITYIGFHIVDELEWGRGAQEKIAFAAFYHDILLVRDELLEIRNREDALKVELTDREQVIIENHAKVAAELVSNIHSRPNDVEIIIREHHGSRNGIGFNKDLQNTQLNPVSMAFMIAEEFTHAYFSYNGKGYILENAMKRIQARFPTSGQWLKITYTLNSLEV